MHILTLLTLQAAFARDKRIVNPQSTGVVLCGQKQMTEVSSSYCESSLNNISYYSYDSCSLKFHSFLLDHPLVTIAQSYYRVTLTGLLYLGSFDLPWYLILLCCLGVLSVSNKCQFSCIYNSKSAMLYCY